ncbi:hypothetical protein [Azospirillum sp. SYSU D00513]|uniref:hypothetical protein n=1 Tax=Azospirillum sp. SYSU D00513 TaxID=2812561 RepID=UPI001A9680E9|nr:hypothetical protein [Azospirillum sp. SYSU D00513]
MRSRADKRTADFKAAKALTKFQDLISTVTGAVIEEVVAWQNRTEDRSQTRAILRSNDDARRRL